MTTAILFPATPEQLGALYACHIAQAADGETTIKNAIKHLVAAQDIQTRLRAARDHQEHEPV